MGHVFLLVILVISVLLIVDALNIYRQLRGALSRSKRSSKLDAYPPLSVIRPIRGLDVEAGENIKAAFDHGYPGEVEMIFVFDDDEEPAVNLVKDCIRELPMEDKKNAHIVYCGSPPPGHTGKQNAMAAGLRIAGHEIIVFADSDIRPAPGALNDLIAALLSSPLNGASFAPVLVASPVETMGDAGYAMMLNGLYGPAAQKAANENSDQLDFIMGQFMAMRRETLEKIGGLDNLEGQLVDDMYLGELFKKAGLSNVVSPSSVPIIQHGLTSSQFFGIYRRWIAFSRSGLPSNAGSIKMLSIHRALLFWLGLAIVAIGMVLHAPLLVLSGLGTTLVVSWTIGALHLRFGGAALSPIHWLATFGLVFIAPAVFLTNRLTDEIDWRGRSYQLDSNARLAFSANKSERGEHGTGGQR